MMRHLTFTFAACACFFLASCATKPQGGTQAVSKRATAAEYPVIVRLVSRSETFIVRAGPDGPLYSAQKPNGQTIVVNVTLEELRTGNPLLYNKLRPVVANDTAVVLMTANRSAAAE